MRRKFENLAGQRFGEWTVLAYYDTRNGHHRWKCRCNCRRVRIVWQNSLREGRSTRCRLCVAPRIKHGYCGTPTHTVWCHVLRRCLTPTDKDWPKYGGRGITVCKRWQGRNGFANFLADVGHRPRDWEGKLKWIDRRDNTGNYEPRNVRWATARMQQRNKGSNARTMLKNGPVGAAATLCSW